MIITDKKFIDACLIGRIQDIFHLIMGFDGGGARGALTARFLMRLEAATNIPLWKLVDLFGGISTGSIIAGCLACGVPAKTIDDFYGQCGKFFVKNWLPPFPFKPIYKKEAVKDGIRQLIGNQRMGEVVTKLMIGTVDLCTDDNIYFKSWKPEHQDVMIVDAMERSFSAAVYFGATPVAADQKVYADGGEGNGNCPLIELMLEGYKLGFRDQGMYILSVGTGESDNTQSYKKASGYSPAFGQTAEYMGLARRQATRTQVNYASQVRWMNRKFDFCRADITIPSKIDELAGTEHIKEYQEYGDRLASMFIADAKIDQVCCNIGLNKLNFTQESWLKREIYLKTQELNTLTKGAM